jgi:hypothetical protein
VWSSQTRLNCGTRKRDNSSEPWSSLPRSHHLSRSRVGGSCWIRSLWLLLGRTSREFLEAAFVRESYFDEFDTRPTGGISVVQDDLP